MRVAVVGAGPGGALLAWHLARDGAAVTVFDASHPREKPCGGGVTARALELLPPAPPDDPLPARLVETCRFESGMGHGVDVPLTRPVAVAARRELDGWLLRRAVVAGAQHVSERVTEVDATGRVRTGAGMKRGTIVVFGAKPQLLPTFRYDCVYRPAFLRIFLRQLQAWGVAVAEAQIHGSYESNSGDLVWMPLPSARGSSDRPAEPGLFYGLGRHPIWISRNEGRVQRFCRPGGCPPT